MMHRPQDVRGAWSRRALLAAMVLAVLAVAAPGRDTARAAQTAPPKRIISLVPALTEMVFAMGAGDRVIAVSSYDDTPPQVQSLPRVGALLDPDVERIITLRPDLVLVYGSQTDLMTQLTRASIAYFDYRHAGLAGVTSTIRAIGQRIGRAKEAEGVASGIEGRLAAIRQRTATLTKPRTLLIFGRERGALRNIYASGGRGFLHDMLVAAGGVNVFADVAAESVQASTEMILTRAPDVIIELRTAEMLEADDRAQELTVWSALASLPAVRNRRVHLLTRKGLAVPGPGVADSTEEFTKVLHPR
jgi:iron complex transport system substrate-binding protein